MKNAMKEGDEEIFDPSISVSNFPFPDFL